MPLNLSTYNITNPTPVVEVHSEFQNMMLIAIFFCQFAQLAITLYFLSFTKQQGGDF